MADPATISNGHVVLNGVKREHEHEVVMTLAGLFKARNIMPVYICMCRMVQEVDIGILYALLMASVSFTNSHPVQSSRLAA